MSSKEESADGIAPETLRARARITEGGGLVIPEEFLRAMGVSAGDAVSLRLTDGELRVFSIRHGIKRAQEIVRRYIPEGRSLADELIAERRAEAERE